MRRTVWVIFQLASFAHLLTIQVVHAAPSVEACPHDSVLSNDACVCNGDSCIEPPCLWNLTVARNSTDVPGSCCPIYSCEGCSNDTLIDGKCPCAPKAVINDRGVCECVDKERHLVGGECVCNPQQCELPQLCDRKSVLVTEEEGCCTKTRCVPCPEDSESTNLETDELEDHCVCLPCNKDCGLNKTAVIKKRGTGFPGNCCDLYECRPVDSKDTECIVGDIIYADGDEWSTSDKQKCRCQNRLSLCSKIHEEMSCFNNGKLYSPNQTWMLDDGCTNCTCVNGEEKCIANYCDYQERVLGNTTKSCVKPDRVYNDQETWIEEDKCTVCICMNGKEQCDSKKCPNTECTPLINCDRVCPNGLRVNKKGCEICKCNPSKVSPEILTKYNITVEDLINILEEYKRGRTTSSSTTTTTTTQATTTTLVTEIRSENNEKPSITPAHSEEPDSTNWIIAILVILGVLAVVPTAFFCVRRSKKKNSMDVTPTRGNYQTVNTLSENNNTIKKINSI